MDELDEQAHVAVFDVPFNAANERDVVNVLDVARSTANFRGRDLRSSGGHKIGTVKSAVDNGDNTLTLECEVTNSTIFADLLGKQFTGISIVAASLAQVGKLTAHCVRPDSITLVPRQSSVNADQNAIKAFHVRGTDGRLRKYSFAPEAHTGVGRESEMAATMDAIKKAHGVPVSLTGNGLAKLRSLITSKTSRRRNLKSCEGGQEGSQATQALAAGVPVARSQGPIAPERRSAHFVIGQSSEFAWIVCVGRADY